VLAVLVAVVTVAVPAAYDVHEQYCACCAISRLTCRNASLWSPCSQLLSSINMALTSTAYMHIHTFYYISLVLLLQAFPKELNLEHKALGDKVSTYYNL
jgi:hypothetical protein